MRLINLLLAFALLFGGISFAQNDVPLGDVARKKSTTAKAKRVITEDDIPSAPLAPEPAPSETKKAADPTEAQLATADVAAANPDGKPLTPEQKLQSMQVQAEKLKTYEASLTKHLKQIEERLENEPSEFRRNMYSEALQRQAGTLESFRKQRAELEAAIAQQQANTKNPDTTPSSSETPAN